MSAKLSFYNVSSKTVATGRETPAIASEIDLLFNAKPGPELRHELEHEQISAGSCFHQDDPYRALADVQHMPAARCAPFWSACFFSLRCSIKRHASLIDIRYR
jgi:hypothetical protein